MNLYIWVHGQYNLWLEFAISSPVHLACQLVDNVLLLTIDIMIGHLFEDKFMIQRTLTKVNRRWYVITFYHIELIS